MFRIRAHFTTFNFIRRIRTILNPEQAKKFSLSAWNNSVLAGYLSGLGFLCVLCGELLRAEGQS